MNIRRKLKRWADKVIKTVDSNAELLFPSQTATRLMQILGASTLVVGGIRRHGRPLTIVLWRGHLLRSENFKLNYVDGRPILSNDLKMAITLEDDDYTRDIIVEQEMDDKFAQAGYIVRWIPERWLNNPERVKTAVQQFI